MRKLIYIFVILIFNSCYTINLYDCEQVKKLEVKLPKTENCQHCGYDKHEDDFSYPHSDGCNTATCHGNGTFSVTSVWCGGISPLIDGSTLKAGDSIPIFPNWYEPPYLLTPNNFNTLTTEDPTEDKLKAFRP